MSSFTLTAHIKAHWRLAYPVMLSQLGHVLMGFTDNVMIGHVNVESLAAAGLSTVIFNVFMLFGIGVSYAITPLVAAGSGENNSNTITQVLRHGLVINFICSVLLVGVVLVGKSLLYYINQPPAVVELTIPYLSIIAFSLIPMMVFQTFKQFAEGLSQTKIAMVIMIAANVVNIALNYLLIYGHGGFPALGLNGAGYATLLSRIFMAIAIAAYIYNATFFMSYKKGFSIGGYSKKLFKKILHIGLPSGAQFIFEVAAFDFSLVMMGWLGTQTLAAHQIAINLATISYMTTAGLATAATIRIGYYLGSGDFKNLKMATNASLLLSVFFMLIWTCLFISANDLLPLLYVSDPSVLKIASSLLIIAGLFQLADGIQVVCTGALRGLQDVKVPSFFIFVAYWIIGLPLGYCLAFILEYGAIGIWLGLLIGLVCTASAMYLRLRSLSNKLYPLQQSHRD